MPKPGPLPAELIPDCSKLEDFNAAYRKARSERVPFVCVSTASQGTWTAKVDVWSAPVLPVSQGRQDLLDKVIEGLVAQDLARTGTTGSEYFTVSGLESEALARRVAAATHAGLYGDLLPLEELLPVEPVRVERAAVDGVLPRGRAAAPVTGWDVIRESADEAADMDDLGHLVGLVGSAVGQLSVLLARATERVLDPSVDQFSAAADLPVLPVSREPSSYCRTPTATRTLRVSGHPGSALFKVHTTHWRVQPWPCSPWNGRSFTVRGNIGRKLTWPTTNRRYSDGTSASRSGTSPVRPGSLPPLTKATDSQVSDL